MNDPRLRSSIGRFEPGARGGCEAQLFEFREAHSPDASTIRIATVSLDDALTYLRWHGDNFQPGTIGSLGLILLVSGSPID